MLGDAAGARLVDPVKRQALAAFAIRVGAAGLAFLTQILFARLMGAPEFGAFSVAFVVLLVLGHAASLGLGESVIRFLPRYMARGRHAPARGLVRFGTLASLIGGSLFCGAGFIVLAVAQRWIGDGHVAPLLVALACLPAFALQDWLEGLARALGRPVLALASPYLMRPLLMTVFMLGLVAAGLPADATGAMLCLLAATVVTSLIQSIAVLRLAARMLGPGPQAGRRSAWLTASLPLVGVYGLDQLAANADILVLGALAPPAHVAVYAAAAKTLALAAFAHYALAVVVGRSFSTAHAAGGRDALSRVARETANLTFGAAVLAVAALALLGWPLLALFGPDYTSGYPLILILSLAVLARAGAGQGEELLVVTAGQRVMLAIAVVNAAAAGVAMALLIPAFGLEGAAAGAVLAALLRSGLVALAARRRLGIAVWPGRRYPVAGGATP
jgi:O-antigen/teichoic acid export membrane protein